MLSANFKPKRTAAASRGFLAMAQRSCIIFSLTHNIKLSHYQQPDTAPCIHNYVVCAVQITYFVVSIGSCIFFVHNSLQKKQHSVYLCNNQAFCPVRLSQCIEINRWAKISQSANVNANWAYKQPNLQPPWASDTYSSCFPTSIAKLKASCLVENIFKIITK